VKGVHNVEMKVRKMKVRKGQAGGRNEGEEFSRIFLFEKYFLLERILASMFELTTT
jgi:hypothetical protein